MMEVVDSFVLLSRKLNKPNNFERSKDRKIALKHASFYPYYLINIKL